MTHKDLCKLTAQRFANEKTMALYEVTMNRVEKPDVLVFDSSGHTNLFEIKMTREDFLADKLKECRKHPEFGETRAYVCYGDFIKAEEVPKDWGLYHYKHDKFYCIKKAYKIPCTPEQRAFLNKNAVELLVNHIICEKTNIVFSQRVLENRIKYKKS